MITENFRLSVLVRYPYILFGVDDATPHLHIVHAHIAFAACYIRKFNIILSKDMLNAHAIIIVCGTVVRGTCGLNSFTCDPVSTLRLLIIMDFLLFFFVSSFVSRSRRQTILLRMETSQTRDVYVRLFRAPSFGSAAICDAMRRTG